MSPTPPDGLNTRSAALPKPFTQAELGHKNVLLQIVTRRCRIRTTFKKTARGRVGVCSLRGQQPPVGGLPAVALLELGRAEIAVEQRGDRGRIQRRLLAGEHAEQLGAIGERHQHVA